MNPKASMRRAFGWKNAIILCKNFTPLAKIILHSFALIGLFPFLKIQGINNTGSPAFSSDSVTLQSSKLNPCSSARFSASPKAL